MRELTNRYGRLDDEAVYENLTDILEMRDRAQLRHHLEILIEDVRQIARESGYEDGVTAGNDSGYEAGWDNGYEAGSGQ